MGYVCSNDMGIVFERDPDTVRGPDVALYLDLRRYDELTAKFTDRLPALIVEVLSPHDQIGRMMRRINQFLSKGVAMVWLVDPAARNVTVCVANQLPVILEEGDTLADFPLLPDFRCPVSELFAMAGDETAVPPPQAEN
jgi:Uma2 family endonuclease